MNEYEQRELQHNAQVQELQKQEVFGITKTEDCPFRYLGSGASGDIGDRAYCCSMVKLIPNGERKYRFPLHCHGVESLDCRLRYGNGVVTLSLY